MIKVHGILFVEKNDKEGEIVSVQGTDLRLHHAPIKNGSGNLLGKVTDYAPVYRAINDDTCKLAMLAGLVSGAPSGDENVLTGHSTYLELTHPFVKINATLMENSYLKAAIKAGNLFFSLSGKVLERKGNLISKCIIDSVILGLHSAQKECRVYLDEV